MQNSRVWPHLFEGSSGDISISRNMYAHRAIPEVFVQEIKITNPTGKFDLNSFQLPNYVDWRLKIESMSY